ncbi:unnamed protein product [Urochloa decumbens]|uniref:Uncharacterized protein n=1 Tax=Urochloa decumbens TaxID=240449 RepID=A0ABC9H189_9POAL
MNSRPIVLIFLLLVLIITSQFEWKQQIGEAEANPTTTRRRQQALEREDVVKEKLLHCRGSNSTAHTTSGSLLQSTNQEEQKLSMQWKPLSSPSGRLVVSCC